MTNEKISKHFTRSEIACKCGCGFDSMDAETLKIADEVRDFVGYPITPSSGARCLIHNRNIGSSDTSQHVKARAMDLPLKNPKLAYDWLCVKYPDRYGFGLYKTFIHIDTATGPARRW
ncbi:MAG: D-Ala-D-Ala carboxypeptidase family metallohydrolase [Gammaproteobacteria bacterium]|nr:D-Ala-D-Ala carboxypeptidase family metallohydrolase [Gammaproteobacteria bacterium]